MTKLGGKSVHAVRTRGGNTKFRALKLETGNFAWGSESNVEVNLLILSYFFLDTTRKTRLVSVVYNSSNNEFVRTNTLVKNSIIQVDAAPFLKFYEQHYGVSLVKKKKKEGETVEEAKKQSKHVLAVLKHRKEENKLDPLLEEQFKSGRLYAAIASRPGQTGRADGYILEGKELEFYLKKLQKKKEGKGKAQ
jgi:small subunit ribosomal protein S8e